MAHYALKKQPRTRSLAATSDCIVTRADGSSYVMPKSKPRAGLSETDKALRAKVRARERANRAIDIINARDARTPNVRNFNLATIHNPNE